MSYPYTEIRFKASDGYEIKGAFYQAQDNPNSELTPTPAQRIIIIGSAFGVPFQYYKHIAGYLAENGVSVLTFDYRGISHSKEGNMSTKDILMQHWGELDIEAAIQYVERTYQPEHLYYMGHSAGGQIVGLAPSSVKFEKIIIAASGVGSWRLWPGLQKYALAAIWYLVFPLVMALQFGDFFKSRFLGPIPVPKNAVKQWLSWARSKDYLFTPVHGLDTSAYQKINADILGITISDDWYAPKEARDGLLKHYSNANKEVIYITPGSIDLKGIGHFGLFKKKQEIRRGIWQPIVNFLND